MQLKLQELLKYTCFLFKQNKNYLEYGGATLQVEFRTCSMSVGVLVRSTWAFDRRLISRRECLLF